MNYIKIKFTASENYPMKQIGETLVGGPKYLIRLWKRTGRRLLTPAAGEFGAKIHAPEKIIVPPKSEVCVDSYTLADIPQGYAGMIIPAGNLKILKTHISVVENGGSLKVILENPTTDSYSVFYGAVIGKLIIVPRMRLRLVE